MKKSKNKSIGSASNAEITSHNQAGAGGRGLSSMAAAFDTLADEIIQAGAVQAAGAGESSESTALNKLSEAGPYVVVSVEDDLKLVTAKASALNKHLMGCGHDSYYVADGWLPPMEDGMQCAMLDLQLWRRGLAVVLDDTGAEKISVHMGAKLPTASKVVYAGLRRGLNRVSRGRSKEVLASDFDGDDFDSGGADLGAIFAAASFEDWRCEQNEGGYTSDETPDERAARRLAALPAVLEKLVQLGTAGKPTANAIMARRRKFTARLQAWGEALLTGQGRMAAARAGGFASSFGRSELQTIGCRLRQAGVRVENAEWRKAFACRKHSTLERAQWAEVNQAIRADNAARAAAARATVKARRAAHKKAAAARKAAARAAQRAAMAPQIAAARAARAAAKRARARLADKMPERRAKHAAQARARRAARRDAK